ncbi:glycosyltransferase [Candidatus Xianfuyuplasma coldseepsis]|uniref:Glycosyltransferase n=1 Tax=Candidatus Xianfuyuplasma coldseepsis TaxID=2782163 RepID=A0A7L7KPP4_9MOLU|nr:glycosyltransferase [Xianfuyuplasma coldseepsis]QMS84535.1 glycosyltransferase [Xianfuyuplasma coldseepsis]
MSNFSVLMSVYTKENPEYLKKSIESILNQTIKPSQIVIIKDGPLKEELNQVIDEYVYLPQLVVHQLEQNVGLGVALNVGLNLCSNEIVARMDSDDESLKNRFEMQLAYLENDKDCRICGTNVIEEYIDYDISNRIKKVPKKHEDILKYIKYRNPINHPTVMFYKSDVIEVGSYLKYPFFEDYFLWARMMVANFKFHNIQTPLVKMRVSLYSYSRRGGYKYFIQSVKLNKYMLNNKLLNLFSFLISLFISLVTRVVFTSRIRRMIYIKALRKPHNA